MNESEKIQLSEFERVSPQFPVFRGVSGGAELDPIKGCRMARARVRRAVSILAGLLVVGLSGLAYISYRRDIHQARQRVSTGSQIVQTPCGPIEYALAGDGPLVLVVHGAGGGYDQGLEIGEPLHRLSKRRPFVGGAPERSYVRDGGLPEIAEGLECPICQRYQNKSLSFLAINTLPSQAFLGIFSNRPMQHI